VTSPVKKEKKPFIEPDLKSFMERNMTKLKVFANITDMKTWKKKNKVVPETDESDKSSSKSSKSAQSAQSSSSEKLDIYSKSKIY
jgi:protein required for attachment to host cells